VEHLGENKVFLPTDGGALGFDNASRERWREEGRNATIVDRANRAGRFVSLPMGHEAKNRSGGRPTRNRSGENDRSGGARGEESSELCRELRFRLRGRRRIHSLGRARE